MAIGCRPSRPATRAAGSRPANAPLARSSNARLSTRRRSTMLLRSASTAARRSRNDAVLVESAPARTADSSARLAPVTSASALRCCVASCSSSRRVAANCPKSMSRRGMDASASDAWSLQGRAAPVAAERPLQYCVGDQGRVRIIPTWTCRGLRLLQCLQSKMTAGIDFDVDPVDVLPTGAVLSIAHTLVEAEARLGHVFLDDEEIGVHHLRLDGKADIRNVGKQVAAQHGHDSVGGNHLAGALPGTLLLRFERIRVDRQVGESL